MTSSPPPHQTIEPPVLSSEIAARILEHALWMRREGYRFPIIEAAVKDTEGSEVGNATS